MNFAGFKLSETKASHHYGSGFVFWFAKTLLEERNNFSIHAIGHLSATSERKRERERERERWTHTKRMRSILELQDSVWTMARRNHSSIL
jgi:hypothetical protein